MSAYSVSSRWKANRLTRDYRSAAERHRRYGNQGGARVQRDLVKVTRVLRPLLNDKGA
jgi:hypothetical protein